jgi:hypothetical protein
VPFQRKSTAGTLEQAEEPSAIEGPDRIDQEEAAFMDDKMEEELMDLAEAKAEEHEPSIEADPVGGER